MISAWHIPRGYKFIITLWWLHLFKVFFFGSHLIRSLSFHFFAGYLVHCPTLRNFQTLTVASAEVTWILVLSVLCGNHGMASSALLVIYQYSIVRQSGVQGLIGRRAARGWFEIISTITLLIITVAISSNVIGRSINWCILL